MKSQKGITLISITIYVIVMAIVVGIVAILSTFFYSNVNDANEAVDPLTEYTKFNSFFTDEINNREIEVLGCGTTSDGQNYIAFSNGVQYTYIPENQSVYRNRAKIAKGIKQCEFKLDVENYKNVIKVTFDSGDKIRENTYTLNN